MPRSSDYTDEIADIICDLLGNGKSLVQICNLAGMPHRTTVVRWMAANAEFAAKCARVREGPQADYAHDEMVEIEAKVLSGELAPDAARVALSSKQWRAAKLAPKKYGDKLITENTSTVKVETTNRLVIDSLSDLELDALEGALRATVAQMDNPVKTIEHEE